MTGPITALDHVVLMCPDIGEGIAAYSTLLGVEPAWQSASDGLETAIFRTANTGLELIAPAKEGQGADRLRALLEERGPGLTSLAFATDDIEAAHRLFVRRGLDPDAVSNGSSTDAISGEERRWRRFRCADAAMAGIKTFILQAETQLHVPSGAADAVQSLDHIVISTPNPERALALYGARLGLDLRLDRTAEQWKTRFLLFRTGSLTFEVIHRLNERMDPNGPDRIWGLTWAVDDLGAAHARLAKAGLNISEIRSGRKPGSEVFTVRDKTLGVPTLFISHKPR